MLQSPRRTKVHFKHLVNMHSLELSNNPYVEYTILISLFTTSRYLTKLLPRPSLCPFRASLRSNRPLPFHHLVHNLPPPTILSTTCRCTPTYHHACCILHKSSQYTLPGVRAHICRLLGNSGQRSCRIGSKSRSIVEETYDQERLSLEQANLLVSRVLPRGNKDILLKALTTVFRKSE